VVGPLLGGGVPVILVMMGAASTLQHPIALLPNGEASSFSKYSREQYSRDQVLFMSRLCGPARPSSWREAASFYLSARGGGGR